MKRDFMSHSMKYIYFPSHESYTCVEISDIRKVLVLYRGSGSEGFNPLGS